MKTKPASAKKIKKVDGRLTVGIDIGDQWSHYCTLSETGEVIEEGRFRTTPQALAKQFAGIDTLRVAIESGTHSIWINEQLRGYGHEVIVAKAQELNAISRSDRKSDRVDAEKLARYARLDPSILRPRFSKAVRFPIAEISYRLFCGALPFRSSARIGSSTKSRCSNKYT